jgi:hypothetical protein
MSPRQPAAHVLHTLALLTLTALAWSTLACDQGSGFKAPAGARPRVSDSGSDPAPATPPPPTYEQRADEVRQKWQDAQDAGSDQEKIDAANAALAAQQNLADSSNQPSGGNGQ